MKRFVVFSGQSELWWVRILKPGFRHCYALIHDGRHWITLDPLSHITEIAVHHHVPADFDLPGWLETRGKKVVAVPENMAPTTPAPWMLFTCVEAVKRVFGIRRRFILTPWQLYKHLKKPNTIF
jgi:hypothetical protein